VTLKIALMVEGQEGVGWADWLALGQACETSGLHGLFRSDHYATGQPQRDPGALDAWVVLGALSARTGRIRLGTLVSPVTFRHPSVLAKSAVTVDHISGGRAELGIGAGWQAAEHQQWGFPFPPLAIRQEQLAEQAEIIRRQWEGEPFSFAGRHYQAGGLTARPRPVQRPGPPLIIGGKGGARSIALAVAWADEYNTTHPTVARCRELRQALDQACARAGRDPASLRLSVMTGIVTGTSDPAVRAHAARVGARLDGTPEPGPLLDRVRATWLTGTTEQVAGQVAAYAAAGVDRMMLQHHAFEDLDLIGLLGHDLIPRLTDGAPPGPPAARPGDRPA
jgi:F420-dependent oxidoreductase-like protein